MTNSNIIRRAAIAVSVVAFVAIPPAALAYPPDGAPNYQAPSEEYRGTLPSDYGLSNVYKGLQANSSESALAHQEAYRQDINDFGPLYTSPDAALVQGDVKDGIGETAALAELEATSRAAAAGAAPVVHVVAVPDGFHWDDAGFGAAAAFGLVVLAAGTSVAVLYRRRAGAAIS